jgi:hypothetical protein
MHATKQFRKKTVHFDNGELFKIEILCKICLFFLNGKYNVYKLKFDSFLGALSRLIIGHVLQHNAKIKHC